MAMRGATARGVLVLLLAFGPLVLVAACDEQTATIHGTVPLVNRPIPQGDVHLDVVAATDPSATPVAIVSSDSGWFSMEVPAGTYVVRILSFDGTVEAVSRQVDVDAGGDAEAVFETPQG
jgi:hypothetical protein